jgi:hypothetical protein
MQVDLTEMEIEAINIDLSHILKNCNVHKDQAEVRQSILSKLKPKSTLKELTQITEQWVKDNGIVVGSKIKVNDPIWVEAHDKVGTYESTCGEFVLIIFNGERFGCKINQIEPYKEEYVPFDFEDRDLFRDKWIRARGGNVERRIICIDKFDIVVCTNSGKYCNMSYETAFDLDEFIDGTPFGKLKQ